MIESPELRKRRPVDGEHGLEVWFVHPRHKMLRGRNRGVEAESHERKNDVVDESGTLPRLSSGS